MLPKFDNFSIVIFQQPLFVKIHLHITIAILNSIFVLFQPYFIIIVYSIARYLGFVFARISPLFGNFIN
jgi:hypothetical protein